MLKSLKSTSMQISFIRIIILFASLLLFQQCGKEEIMEPEEVIMPNEEEEEEEEESTNYLEGACKILEKRELKIDLVTSDTVTCVYPYVYNNEGNLISRTISTNEKDSITYLNGKVDKIHRVTSTDYLYSIDHIHTFRYDNDKVVVVEKFSNTFQDNYIIEYDSLIYENDKLISSEIRYEEVIDSVAYGKVKWKDIYYEYEGDNLTKVTQYIYEDPSPDSTIIQERFLFSEDTYSGFYEYRNPYYGSIIPDQRNLSFIKNLYTNHKSVGGPTEFDRTITYDSLAVNEYGYPTGGYSYDCQ